MTNSDLILIKQVGYILAVVIVIGFMLYHHNKEAKRIMGNFAALLIIFWDDIKEKFWH